MTQAQEIAQALGGSKKTPDGYICRCPCHDDKSASLSLKETDKGILLNCFAGCRWEDIKIELERLGLIKKNSRNASISSNSQNGSYNPVRLNRYTGAKFYIYHDLVGNILCRKVKMPDKKMWFERYENGQYIPGLAGMTVPLYNIQAVIASDIIYLCEGEKDASTLITLGLCGTTNHAGAKSWGQHLTEQLRGKQVIIIPDNDDAGRKRVAIVSKAIHGIAREIRVFIPDGVKEHGDITDWVEAGGDVNTILARSTMVEKKVAPKKATREDYYQLIERTLGNPKRCIFNEKLMYQDRDSSLWNPAINALEIIKSEALFENETRESKFNKADIQAHFATYEASKPLEFLVDIPDWDGEDRISAMAYLVKLNPESDVSETAFSELLKEWCSLVFQRLHNPMIQNRILVLQGGQGIGKDTWTSMLVDGLGQFSIPLAVVKEDKDTYLNLHRGLIMKISEFDKTAKTEVSTLKDIITAPSTNLRAPYDKDSKLRLNRCSFISSANAENLLRDSTGNRRFLIFEIESIEYAYSGWDQAKIYAWQMQCLAQMVHLAACKYTASVDSWRQMRDYIEKQTPSDPAEEMADQFISKIKQQNIIDFSYGEYAINDESVTSTVLTLSKETGIKPRSIRMMLQRKIGVLRRIGTKRFWVLRIPPIS